MTDLLDAVGLVLITVGCFLALSAGIAQQRFPDVAARAHAAAKPQVLGLILVLCGVAVSLRQTEVTTMAAVVIALQLATSPVSSHMVARSAYRYGHLDPGSLVVDELSRDIDAGVVERPGSGGERQRADPADGAGPRPGRLSGSDSTTR